VTLPFISPFEGEDVQTGVSDYSTDLSNLSFLSNQVSDLGEATNRCLSGGCLSPRAPRGAQPGLVGGSGGPGQARGGSLLTASTYVGIARD